VREILETLPTALQSHATEEIGLQSPFARNLRTHFARFTILDQPYFNGRDHNDALLSRLRRTDLLTHQPVDQLSCPYLLMMIDFDLLEAHEGTGSGEGEPRRYLEELWCEMEPELRSIFGYCYSFPDVHDAASFATFLLACQVETTMPFHDYWWKPPVLPSLSILKLAAAPVGGLLLPLIAVAFKLLGWDMAFLLGIVLLIAGLVFDYFLVMQRGNRAFPAAPETSLRHVLKSLYLQQAFTRFAMAQQHRDPGEWGAAFRTFLETHRPGDLDGPTQPPGVIRSRLPLPGGPA